MAEKTEDQSKKTHASNYTRVNLIPFTGGIIIFVYAFFWPDGYGRWLGTIVKAFRETAGF